MNLSKTAQYAIRILSYMVSRKADIYSASLLISELNISDKYLRRIMTDLTKAGLIYSIQGRDGGYKFNKLASDIKIIEIIEAVENIDKYSNCILGFAECSDVNPCALHNEWVNIRTEIFKGLFLNNLQEVADKSIIVKF
jgi:Rrf2 family protein